MKRPIAQIYRRNRDYKAVIFLDRDGVINKEVDYLHKPEDIKILPTVISGIKLLNKNKIAIIVITNQVAVARGLLSVATAKKLNDEIVKQLADKGAYIDAVYFCPHHPNADSVMFRTKCSCRKPGTLLFEMAIKQYPNIRTIGTIGDRTADIMAGAKLGIKTVVVKTGYKGQDGKYKVRADLVCDNFASSVKMLLK